MADSDDQGHRIVILCGGLEKSVYMRNIAVLMLLSKLKSSSSTVTGEVKVPMCRCFEHNSRCLALARLLALLMLPAHDTHVIRGWIVIGSHKWSYGMQGIWSGYLGLIGLLIYPDSRLIGRGFQIW